MICTTTTYLKKTCLWTYFSFHMFSSKTCSDFGYLSKNQLTPLPPPPKKGKKRCRSLATFLGCGTQSKEHLGSVWHSLRATVVGRGWLVVFTEKFTGQFLEKGTRTVGMDQWMWSIKTKKLCIGWLYWTLEDLFSFLFSFVKALALGWGGWLGSKTEMVPPRVISY